ncbi:hypothetical protein MKY41_12295 [Sporosarcina sp. FSL W7-1349]|uniref:hypothetical protein n=1 Tax=Sporosarcina sp. FSL W7-1349 TaxID=2921561 RepID=UPI0030FBD427
MNRVKWGIFVLLFVVIFAFIGYAQKEPYSTEKVLQSAWDKFELESFQIGVSDPIIWVEIAEGENEEDVRKYLEKELSKPDLKKFQINIKTS